VPRSWHAYLMNTINDESPRKLGFCRSEFHRPVTLSGRQAVTHMALCRARSIEATAHEE
jgi:hypothetical protein